MSDKKTPLDTALEALTYADQIMREHDGDNGGEVKDVGQDIELGSTSFISLKRWISEALAALRSMDGSEPTPAVEHAATLGVSEGLQAKLDRANKLLDLRRAQKEPTTIIAWVPEDELPASLSGEAYSALFEHSKVDFIRLFPVFGPAPAVVELSHVIKAGDATFDAWLEEVKGDGWPEPSLGFIVHKDKWINVTKPFRP